MRNRQLEDFSVSFTCSNTGCRAFVMPRQKEEHEAACPCSPVPCLEPHCPVIAKSEADLCRHLTDAHRASVSSMSAFGIGDSLLHTTVLMLGSYHILRIPRDHPLLSGFTAANRSDPLGVILVKRSHGEAAFSFYALTLGKAPGSLRIRLAVSPTCSGLTDFRKRSMLEGCCVNVRDYLRRRESPAGLAIMGSESERAFWVDVAFSGARDHNQAYIQGAGVPRQRRRTAPEEPEAFTF